jgi:hypothetical protein
MATPSAAGDHHERSHRRLPMTTLCAGPFALTGVVERRQLCAAWRPRHRRGRSPTPANSVRLRPLPQSRKCRRCALARRLKPVTKAIGCPMYSLAAFAVASRRLGDVVRRSAEPSALTARVFRFRSDTSSTRRSPSIAVVRRTASVTAARSRSSADHSRPHS